NVLDISVNSGLNRSFFFNSNALQNARCERHVCLVWRFNLIGFEYVPSRLFGACIHDQTRSHASLTQRCYVQRKFSARPLLFQRTDHGFYNCIVHLYACP
uniref:Uncharacterized protein n=1 Tax=Aegilops tauschii subsp. strangulata TaxID=200361 RepID=A0A453EIM9_AEGTS